MKTDERIEYIDAFKAINPLDSRLQLVYCWCYEAGLTRFHNSITALAQWMESVEDGVSAVYFLPTTRDAEIAIVHLEADSALAPLVSKTSPEAKHLLVKSYQQWVGESLIGKTLAVRDLVIVADLGAGVTSSYVSAMAAALFTELQPRDDSPLHTFSIVVLQEITFNNTMGNYTFDFDAVHEVVERKGWQVVGWNTKTGSFPELQSVNVPPGCTFDDSKFEETQMANSLVVLKDCYQQALVDGRAGEACKALVFMSRSRFRRVMDTVNFAKARSFFIHDRTSAKLVQAICADEETGLTVVGIDTEVCILPRMKGLRWVIVDGTADKPDFDFDIGHPITRETDTTSMRLAQVFDIAHGAVGLEVYILWDNTEHQPEVPVLFPFHDTDEMFHLIVRIGDICPGQNLQTVPCLPLPIEMSVLYERFRRLRLWGVVDYTGSPVIPGVIPTEGKGRLVSELAQHESNIHSLLLLAGAADHGATLSAQARHLLVWLAAVIAHDPQNILAHSDELPHGSPADGPASSFAQRGSIWSAFLGLRDFLRRNDGNATQDPPAHAVEATEAQQVLDRVAFWVGKLSLPAVDPETIGPEDIVDLEKEMVEGQLVYAFVYNIAIFDMNNTKLADVLSGAELCLDDNTRASLVAAGQGFQAPVVFAVYTDLHRSARGISARNLTVVSEIAWYDELVKIAPLPDAPPGTSPIDLAILQTRTAPPIAVEQAPASPSSAQVDWMEGEVEARELD